MADVSHWPTASIVNVVARRSDEAIGGDTREVGVDLPKPVRYHGIGHLYALILIQEGGNALACPVPREHCEALFRHARGPFLKHRADWE